MSSRLRTNISKQLTYYLRHHLDEFRTATRDGYVDIDELLPKLDKNVTIQNYHKFKLYVIKQE